MVQERMAEITNTPPFESLQRATFKPPVGSRCSVCNTYWKVIAVESDRWPLDSGIGTGSIQISFKNYADSGHSNWAEFVTFPRKSRFCNGAESETEITETKESQPTALSDYQYSHQRNMVPWPESIVPKELCLCREIETVRPVELSEYSLIWRLWKYWFKYKLPHASTHASPPMLAKTGNLCW